MIAAAEGPFADDRDRLRIWAITASIRGQKTRGGTLFGLLSRGLTLLHPQNYHVTKYYTRMRIWDDNTQICSLCILIVVYVFLLLSMYSYCSSMYSYCCLCILIVSTYS